MTLLSHNSNLQSGGRGDAVIPASLNTDELMAWLLIPARDPRRVGYESNLNAAAAKYATRQELLGLPPGEHTLGII